MNMATLQKQRRRAPALRTCLCQVIGTLSAVVMLPVLWLYPLQLPASYCRLPITSTSSHDIHLAGPSSTHAFDGGNKTLNSSSSVQQHSSPEHSAAAWSAAAHANLTAFKESLLEAVQNSGNKPFKRAMWSLFAPVVSCPPDRPLKRYPDAVKPAKDGQKILCSLEGEKARAQTVGCIIYSLGSNGDYQFEDSMLKSTKCEIHTFDCTFNGTSRDVKRHFYHKWCIGAYPGKPEYMTLRRVKEILGHEDVYLLKIDVEGYEYPVLAEMRPTDRLPTEIAIEIHVGFKSGRAKSANSSMELALVYLHLANLGYAVYSQEVNEYIPDKGCEFSFIRLDAVMPPTPSISTSIHLQQSNQCAVTLGSVATNWLFAHYWQPAQ